MLGLVVLLFIGAYLLVSVLVVWLAARWARKHNRRAWVWGGLAAFAMYNLVFWDWIPTVAMHKYYCATEAGFWVYKTPEQWTNENPGVLETLEPWPASRIYGRDKVEFELNGGTVRQYNDRFGIWRLQKSELNGLMVHAASWGVIDIQNKRFLFRRTEFSAGPQGAGVMWKSWLNQSVCNHEEAVRSASLAREFRGQLRIEE